jgi:hypothetical protein
MGFVVGKVALGQVFSLSASFSPGVIIPKILCTRSSVTEALYSQQLTLSLTHTKYHS